MARRCGCQWQRAMAMCASAQSARKSLMAKIPFKSASSVDFNKGSAYRAAMLAALLNGDHVLQGASAKLRADRDIAMTAVQHHASSLQYASVALRADREVVLAAVRKGGYALDFCGSGVFKTHLTPAGSGL